MKRHIKKQITLADLIGEVSRYARTDHEVGLVVSDLIHRGIVRFPNERRQRRAR